MNAISRYTALTVTLMSLLLTPTSDAQKLTPVEAKKLQTMIDEIDLKLNGGTEKNNSRALTICQAALKSTKATYEFFMDSTKELEFDRAGKRESDWREWRDRNEDRLKSSEHVAALQFQLRYLVLTLGVATAEDKDVAMKKVLPELVSYYDRVADGFEKLEEHSQILSASVLDSIFAKKLKLDVTVPKNAEWVDSPLPVSQGYEQLILPHYRKAKDSRALQAAWDKRIIQEGKSFEAEDLDRGSLRGGPDRRWNRDNREREREDRREETRKQKVSLEEFKAKRLPELQWGKERDGLLFGSSSAASYAALGRVIRENLAHREAMGWLDELKALAKGGWSGADYYEQTEP